MHSTHDLTRLRDTYLEALLRGDRRGAVALVLQAADDGAAPAALRLQVVQEAQRVLGTLWEANRVTIAQEHTATAIAQIALAHLYDRSDALPPKGRTVWMACVEGELHDLPARIAADHLELAGYDVRFLGANVPTDSLLEELRRGQPDLLALSATLSLHVGALREVVRLVRSVTCGLPIVVGGHAIRWAPALPAQLQVPHAADAEALVREVDRLLAAGVAA